MRPAPSAWLPLLVALALLGLAVFLPDGQARAQASLLDGLVAYYKLDEVSGTRYDAHGANHLVVGPYGVVGSGTGKIGNGVVLNGDGGVLWRESASALAMGDVDFSIVFWAKLDANSSPAPVVVKGEAIDGGAYEYAVLYDAGLWGSGWEFAARSDPFNGETSAHVAWTGLGWNEVGVWKMVFAVYDAAQDLLWIDVNHAGEFRWESLAGGAGDSGGPFFVGGDSGYGWTFDGVIDEVGIWKGRKLWTSEEAMLWNNGAGCSYPFGACGGGPTDTPSPTETPTNTPTPTDTPTPTASPTATDTPMPTDTPTDTATPTNTPSSTPTPTGPPTPTETPTITNTPEPCATAEGEMAITLSSGACFKIERRAGYGQVYVAFGVFALVALMGVRWIYDMVVRWLP